MQPLGGAAEVQLLGKGQEDLDVAQLHGIPSIVNPLVNSDVRIRRCSGALDAPDSLASRKEFRI
jgi:hypothetical protein